MALAIFAIFNCCPCAEQLSLSSAEQSCEEAVFNLPSVGVSAVVFRKGQRWGLSLLKFAFSLSTPEAGAGGTLSLKSVGLHSEFYRTTQRDCLKNIYI